MRSLRPRFDHRRLHGSSPMSRSWQTTTGVALVILGTVLLVLPGPGLLTLTLGLVLLAFDRGPGQRSANRLADHARAAFRQAASRRGTGRAGARKTDTTPIWRR